MTEPDVLQDESQGLAERLGLENRQLVDLFGAAWEPMPASYDTADADDLWWKAGDPVQLMLRPDRRRGVVVLAVPKGEWRSWELVHVPGRTQSVSLAEDAEEIRSTVAQLLKARRASFRYCRYCRSLTPPEYRHGRDVCMGCSERWLGVTH